MSKQRKNHVPSVRQGGRVVPSSTIAAPPSQSARRLPVGKLLLSRKALADVVVCLLLVAAVFAVFGQTARFSFINFDDDEYVYENPHVLNGLTAADVAWAFTHTDAGAYRHPLTLISLMLDAQIVNPRTARRTSPGWPPGCTSSTSFSTRQTPSCCTCSCAGRPACFGEVRSWRPFLRSIPCTSNRLPG